MKFERFFSRSEKQARMLRPDEIEQAAVDTQAAVAENLGNDVADGNLKELSDAEVTEAAEANYARFDANDAGEKAAEAWKNIHALAPQIEEEFAQLVATKDTLPDEKCRIVTALETSMARGKEDGTNLPLVMKIDSFSRPDMQRDNEVPAIELFSPEIKEAFEVYFAENALAKSRGRIVHERGGALYDERKERGLT